VPEEDDLAGPSNRPGQVYPAGPLDPVEVRGIDGQVDIQSQQSFQADADQFPDDRFESEVVLTSGIDAGVDGKSDGVGGDREAVLLCLEPLAGGGFPAAGQASQNEEFHEPVRVLECR